jgi:2-polyprenyl-6-hydroxyphenyl methylase/3-demethylubiquinone-9 3-methyltransferase
MSTTPEVTVAREDAARFAFGKNWRRFLQSLNEERIAEAEKSLQTMLETDDLAGRSFLDVGCGSGLLSVAAIRLKAKRVHSFDYDPQCVACTQELRCRYFQDAVHWNIEQGSALDDGYLARLGTFDVVYAWGVLHHTGNMWQALENATLPVAAGGKLFIAIYNDQGMLSRFWRQVKKNYCRSVFLRVPIILFFGTYILTVGLIKDLVLLRNPLARFREYKRSRGMSYFTDILDWLGGYPFEVATLDAVFDFFRARGFDLVKIKPAPRPMGNNEFVFLRRSRP